MKVISAAMRHSYFIIFSILVFGCATYYQTNYEFQQKFAAGEIEKANKILDKNKKEAKGNNRLLYDLKKGVILQLMGQFEESNTHFEQAYIFTEDYKKNYSREALSLLTNPNVKPYTGEDHELIFIHYYKALNYLRMGLRDEALVECRRINIKLNALNDKYEKKKNRYSVDPFAHNLMGIIFESSGEINDAFIAYRNAYEAYKEIGSTIGVKAPLQLKMDILRTAYVMGFKSELDMYEAEFGIKYKPVKNDGGELIFFWHNGLGPVKSEWTVNFFLIKGEGGVVNFENKEMGWSFPFYVNQDDDGRTQLGDLKVVRAAFPKYVERKPIFNKAEIRVNNQMYQLEKAEDISSIAFVTLEDRMLREFANSLLRLAIKQAAEEATRKENEGLGALVSIVNAVTEKADTRNWQTLPHDIHYARIPIKDGENLLGFSAFGKGGENFTERFTIDGKKGRTEYFMYNNLDSYPASSYY